MAVPTLRDNLWLHPFAMLFTVALALAVHFALAETAPVDALLLSAAGQAALLLIWLPMIVRRVLKGTGYGSEQVRRDELIVFTLGSLATVNTAWQLLPWTSQTVTLVIIVICLGCSAMLAQWSARQPASNWLDFVLPALIPAGIAVWLLRPPSLASAAAAAAVLGFAAVFMAQRRLTRATLAELRLARASAEAQRDARARFVATASHDLGQPLHSARLFLEQAERAPSDTERRRLAGRAGWALGVADQMLRRLIEHLRLEADEVAADLQPVGAGFVISRVLALHEAAARQSGVALRTLPAAARIWADPALAERALGNLVVNAIRHSGGRRVLVGCRPRGARVRLWVIDDGRGLPHGAADALARGREGLGYGLGLASAARLASLMGGTLGHEPRWRGGAAFFLEFRRVDGLASLGGGGDSALEDLPDLRGSRDHARGAGRARAAGLAGCSRHRSM